MHLLAKFEKSVPEKKSSVTILDSEKDLIHKIFIVNKAGKLSQP
jgi:hypothetical protein